MVEISFLVEDAHDDYYPMQFEIDEDNDLVCLLCGNKVQESCANEHITYTILNKDDEEITRAVLEAGD